jgi:hypothetical protein
MQVIYGGVKYTKVRHAIQCRLCKQTIEAPGFKMCQCNSVGIDDDRILGTEYDDRSIYAATINGKTIWLPNLKDLQLYI